MEIIIKLAPRSYKELRSHIPTRSPAHETIENATRIDHSVEGVLFAGYTLVCDDQQARIIRETAQRYCADAVPDIDKAIAAARRQPT